MPSLRRVTVVSWICLYLLSNAVFAQRAVWQDSTFPYRRTVALPVDRDPPSVVISDLFTHGALCQDGSNLVVYGRRDVVPYQVLQVGPGDYCRLAFQTVEGVSEYHVYYGGDASPTAERPKWTAHDGLWMETRRWGPCDLDSLESLRAAFVSSRRIGCDAVARVFHQRNPFDSHSAPFFTRYIGRFRLPLSGNVMFFTSSQDASFLLIDGKLVVASPGSHRASAAMQAKGSIDLEKGHHSFEYLHAAETSSACMIASWQLPGFDTAAEMSPTVFGNNRVAHIPALDLEHRTNGPLPDFRMAILGESNESGEEPAFVGVQFADTSSGRISCKATHHWEFGDGGSSQQPNPGHLYQHPQAYLVRLAIHQGAKQLEIVNRVEACRSIAIVQEENLKRLARYIESLDEYNAQQLASLELVQLVQAHLLAEQWDQAVQMGSAAFAPTSNAASHTDETRWALVCLLGPVLRYWIAQKHYAQAAAAASDLLVVRPHSAYADRLLYFLALCEGKQNRRREAAAALRTLVSGYPGSAFVDRARVQLRRLEGGHDLLYEDLAIGGLQENDAPNLAGRED